MCQLLGIEREDIELDVLGVETFEQSLERKMKEASRNGAMFNFADSDDEDSNDPKTTSTVRVKAEKAAGRASIMEKGGSQDDAIDLCDSDDEDDDRKLPAKPTKGIAVKDEVCFI